jgi:hypothetical protein
LLITNLQMVIDFATHDPSGTFLIGGGRMDGVIWVYRIEAGAGSISRVAGSPFIEELPPSGFPSAERKDASVS